MVKKSEIVSRLIAEISTLRRFYRNTPEEEKRVIFYSEGAGYYPYFEGLIERLTGKFNHTLCYITSDPDDPILQKPGPRVKPFYLDKLFPFFMAFLNCRVFVMTLTDLHRFHIKRSINPIHYTYVFHSFASTHMMYRQGSFDYYDSILCCGPHQVKEIRKHESLKGLKPKVLVKAGYYRLERIYREYQNRPLSKSSNTKKGVILIAPSWNAGNIIESCGERLVELILKAGYEVILRPHPETMKRSSNIIALLASRFERNPKFTLEKSISGDNSLLSADVLVTDYSAILFEYALGTERPVLFLNTPPKIRNLGYKELNIEPLEISLKSKIGTTVPLDKLQTVPEAIFDLMRNAEKYKKSLSELRKQWVFAFGNSSEIGARYINDLVFRKTRMKT